jgi:hypothetical protein
MIFMGDLAVIRRTDLRAFFEYLPSLRVAVA